MWSRSTTPAPSSLHTVGSADEARRAVGCGVDVVVAQGWEAGGHVLEPGSRPCRWSRRWWMRRPRCRSSQPVDRGCPWCGRRIGSRGAGSVARYPVPPGRRDAHPRGVSPAPDGCRRDRGPVVRLTSTRSGGRTRPIEHSTISTAEAWEAAGCPPLGSRPGEGERHRPFRRRRTHTPLLDRGADDRHDR